MWSKLAKNEECGWVKGLLFLAFVGLLGCSGDGLEPVYPVSGTVTMKGKPIEGAIVAFTPSEKGTAASAVTDASGVYKLTTREAGDGAVAGAYRVTVAKYDKKLEPPKKKSESSDKPTDPYDITNEYPTGYNEMQASEIAASLSKNVLPPRFANPNTSKLEAKVAPGPNTFDFKLD